jgi:hypothetical protein
LHGNGLKSQRLQLLRARIDSFGKLALESPVNSEN